VVPLAALAAFTLGACGSGGDNATDGVASLDDGAADDASTGSAAPTATTEPVDQEEALLEFAACMRENGVDMPDPQLDDDGGVRIQIGGSEPEPGQGQPADVDAAMEECRDLMPRGPVERNGEEFDPTEMQDELLAFAQCMRDHGVDMPDPEFDEDGRIEVGTVTDSADDDDASGGPVLRGPFGTLDMGDPATEAAFEECSEGTGFGMPGRGGAGAATGEPEGDE
jgi:hypothetical protein